MSKHQCTLVNNRALAPLCVTRMSRYQCTLVNNGIFHDCYINDYHINDSHFILSVSESILNFKYKPCNHFSIFTIRIESTTMDHCDPRKIDVLAKEVIWQLSDVIPCSQCHSHKSKQESFGWIRTTKCRGLVFSCRGVKVWNCTNTLSSIQILDIARDLFPEEVRSIESMLFPLACIVSPRDD